MSSRNGAWTLIPQRFTEAGSRARKPMGLPSNGYVGSGTAEGKGLDGELLAACRRGDREGLRLLFETYGDKVYSLAFYMTGSEPLAEDLTQDVFLRAFSGIAGFRGEASLATWLYRIVANACIDERRAQRRLLPLDASQQREFMVQQCQQERNYLRHEIAHAVRAAMTRLKPNLRLTLLLRYVEGLSYEEIAQALGCSSGTVGARLNRGHKILARELSYLRGALG